MSRPNLSLHGRDAHVYSAIYVWEDMTMCRASKSLEVFRLTEGNSSIYHSCLHIANRPPPLTTNRALCSAILHKLV
jgi:hypothetical protein